MYSTLYRWIDRTTRILSRSALSRRGGKLEGCLRIIAGLAIFEGENIRETLWGYSYVSGATCDNVLIHSQSKASDGTRGETEMAGRPNLLGRSDECSAVQVQVQV